MVDPKRYEDMQRVFTAEFKPTTVAHVQSGETTLSSASRQLDIQSTMIHRWIKLSGGGSTAAVGARRTGRMSTTRRHERIGAGVLVQRIP